MSSSRSVVCISLSCGLAAACAQSSERPASADPRAFCESRGPWVCARQQGAALVCAGAPPFTPAQYEECRARIVGSCVGARFAPGCAPSMAETEACVTALSLSSNVCVPESMITACNLCAGS